MTERIDHVAEAQMLYDAEFGTQPNSLGYETADVQHLLNMLGAQVHATLALVEQQRIANIIELSHPRRMPNGGEASYMLYDPETFQLRDDVREGLGL